ncbi:MAG: choice-of-anchor J domain-containing protein, partial [Bacteroidales bacterium]|nr:choice-of-anchor J domain-containing protein [Bacteroidales bacterium]
MCRCFIHVFFVSLLFLFQYVNLFAQIETGETPYSLRYKSVFPDPPVIKMPGYDYDRLREESLAGDNLKKLRYARMIKTDIRLKEAGQRIKLGHGTLYRLAVFSEDAYSISLVFNEFRIPPEAKLFVYNSKRTHIKGAFTSRNNRPSEVFPVAPVNGEQVVVEYFEPDSRAFDGKLKIGKVGHDFLGIHDQMDKGVSGFGDSDYCQDSLDVNCPEGEAWQTVKHAVVKIVSNGSQCTGSLVNNVRSSGQPYLLTANHCLDNQEAAEETVAFFNYESSECNGEEPDTSEYHSLSGANLIATAPAKDQLDFTLIELNNEVPPGYKPYFAGWSLATDNIKRTASIHHPEGDVKKIAKDFDPPVTSTYPDTLYDVDSHWRVKEWDLGTTEFGSSGSPLFNQNKRIIGNLSGGYATCDNPVNDYFAKISRSWDDFGVEEHQLKAWLDPDNTGFTRIDGYLPYDSIPSNLKLQYRESGIRLSWNAPLNPEEVEYYGISRNGEFLDNTSQPFYMDNEVFQDSLYHYKVRAFLSGGDTTGYSKKASLVAGGAESLPFSEGFSVSEVLPKGWYEHNYRDKSNWSVSEGGYNTPENAAEEQYNILFKGQDEDSSKIITPAIDMNGEEYIYLSYFIAIPEQNGNVDHLNLYIRYADTLDWHLIRHYRDPISGWTSDSIYLPNPTANYRVAFEGVSNDGGGIALDSVEIFRDTKAFNPDFHARKDSVCEGDYLYFMPDTSNENFSYSWDFGYGASPRYVEGFGPHTIKYNEPGEKTVQLTINGVYQTTRKGMVTVGPLPSKPTIEVNEDTLSIPSEEDIQWYYDGAPRNGATDSIYIASEKGIYKVQVTNKF